MDIEKIKVQFPEVKFWMFMGRAGSKRIKGQTFPRGVAVPVWDRKAQVLLKRLAYMKQVDESMLTGSATKGKKKAPTRESIVIPENWRELHHKKRISLAAQVSSEDVGTAARADEILAAHTASQAPEPEPEPTPEDPAQEA